MAANSVTYNVTTSPYCINPSENTSLPIASEKLSSKAYGEWKRSTVIALATKNKLGSVDGTLPKPVENEANCAAWKRCDAIIISYILRYLESSIGRSLLFLSTLNGI